MKDKFIDAFFIALLGIFSVLSLIFNISIYLQIFVLLIVLSYWIYSIKMK